MSPGRVLTIACLGIVGLAVLVTIPSVGWGPDDDVPVVTVHRQDFVRRVEAEGHLKAVEATPLTTPVDVPGPFTIAWMAPDGSRVSEGDVVVRFDPTEMEKSLEDGRSDQATAEQKATKRAVERDLALDNLSRDADLAALELDYAREFQSKDPEIFSRSEIIESEIDERLATKRRESAEGRREIQQKLAGADLDLLEIESRKAEMRIEQARQGLRSLEIQAPHDGILVFQRDWRGETIQVGQSVWNGQAVAEIPKLDHMEAEVFVLEADAGGLEEGRPATVILEARPGRPFEATVRKVDALAKPKVRWVPVQYFGVTLDLETTDPEIMKPGQRVRAVLVLDELHEVIVVPREAVFEREGERVVYVRKRWGFDEVEVAVGPTALGRVVIESGLEPGDVIALEDPTASPEPAGESPPGEPAAGGLRSARSG